MPSNHFILCCLLLPLPSSFSSIGSLLMSQLFTSGGQSNGASASASVLPMNIQDWFPLGLISLLSKGLSRVSSSTSLKASSLAVSPLYGPTLKSVYDYWTIHAFVSKVMSRIFNMLSRFLIAFLPRNKCLLISWLRSPSAVILEPEKIKSVTVSIVSPSICHEVMELDAMILFFLMLFLSLIFHSPLLPSSRSSLVPLYFLP